MSNSVPIRDLVNSILPGAASLKPGEVEIFTLKWQALLFQGLNIPSVFKNDYTKYPFEANMLISYLVSRDLLSGVVLGSVLESVDSGKGNIKKITTGPTEVERFSVGDGVKDILKSGGIWETINGQICSLANLLGVYVNGCKGQSVSSMKIRRASDYSYEYNEVEGPQFKNKPD
jgi:hypothetical protein